MSTKNRLKEVLQSLLETNSVDTQTIEGLSKDEMEILMDLHEEGLTQRALVLLDEIDEDREWSSLLLGLAKPKVVKLPTWKLALKYAALIGILLGLGFLMNRGLRNNARAQVMDGAVKLIIEDNGIKLLDESGQQKIVTADGQILGTQSGNTISYSGHGNSDKMIYNTLEVPFGKLFNLELSDGTTVRLNSGSTIRFPARFQNTGNREVTISGEGYFKVSKDKLHPFIVHAEDVSVEVLGTEFNVSCFQEDPQIDAVLVEGSIKMSARGIQDSLVLKPGNMGTWDKNDRTTRLEHVDVQLYTSWLNGELVFTNTTFSNMLKKLERKYDVEIVNQNPELQDKAFTARFNVEVETIEDVLRAISEIQPFTYLVQGNQIIIK